MSTAERLVRLAARTLPPTIRDRHREEWLGDLRDAGEAGIRPSSIALGALLFSVTLERDAPEIAGMPLTVLARRRARWALAFLAVAAVLGFGALMMGAQLQGPLAAIVIASLWIALACVSTLAGVVQLWRAAQASTIAAKVTAALATIGVGLVMGSALAPSVLPGGTAIVAGVLFLLAAGVVGLVLWVNAPVVRATAPAAPVRAAPSTRLGAGRIVLIVAACVASLLVAALLGSTILFIVGILAVPAALILVTVVVLRRRSNPWPGGVRPRSSILARRAVLVSAPIILAFVALGAVDLLVWSPQAVAPSFSLDEIYAALSPADRASGLISAWGWVGFWTVVTLSAAGVGVLATNRRPHPSPRTVVICALLLISAAVVFHFIAGFSLGMNISDTLPPFRGGRSEFAFGYALFGQLALCALILGTIPPPRPRRDAVPLAA